MEGGLNGCDKALGGLTRDDFAVCLTTVAEHYSQRMRSVFLAIRIDRVQSAAAPCGGSAAAVSAGGAVGALVPFESVAASSAAVGA